MPLEGAPITLPTGHPEARPVAVTESIATLLGTSPPDHPFTAISLGLHRFEVFAHNGYEADGRNQDRDGLAYGLRDLALAAVHLLIDLAQRTADRPIILWAEDADPVRLLGQTLLWADHVCISDQVFDAIMNDRSEEELQQAITEQYRLRPLIEAGVVIPVPTELALAARSEAVQQTTAADLATPEITNWVRSQLIFEGPTAREALFVTALDDIEKFPRFWLYSHIDRTGPEVVDASGRFRTQLLKKYDPNHDYRPWKKLVSDQATAHYVQRLNERLLTGDLFAADYLTRSPFEARLLRLKGREMTSPAHAALWANVPVLPEANPRVLAQAAAEDEAVEDLRVQIRGALHAARTIGERAEALSNLAAQLAHAGRQLDRAVRTERRWQAIGPAIAGAGALALGAAGGLPGVAAGALSMAGSLLPYIAARRNRRHRAAFLFYSAQRRRQ